jgi:acyl-CoA thioesterase YciA
VSYNRGLVFCVTGFASVSALHYSTSTHRLILPSDANHHGTLYAGSLLRIALEAAYATAFRAVGDGANLLLRRVLNLECYRPVPIGSMVEIRGRVLHLTRAYLVVGLIGESTPAHGGRWMDGLMGFVQVDAEGRPAEFPEEKPLPPPDDAWLALHQRRQKLLRLRSRNGVE